MQVNLLLLQTREIFRRPFPRAGHRHHRPAGAAILSGLQLLHVKGILHRDLKTANIFITEGIYKIGDMNVSKVQS